MGSPSVAASSNFRKSSSRVGIFLRQWKTPAARAPNFSREQGRIQLLQAAINCATRNSCRPRYGAHAAIPRRASLRRGKQAPSALVETRGHPLETVPNRCFVDHAAVIKPHADTWESPNCDLIQLFRGVSLNDFTRFPWRPGWSKPSKRAKSGFCVFAASPPRESPIKTPTYCSPDELPNDADALAEWFAELCVAAGAIACEVYSRETIEARVKNDRSPVTEADERIEAFLLLELSRRLPGLPIIAEESASKGRRPGSEASFCWSILSTARRNLLRGDLSLPSTSPSLRRGNRGPAPCTPRRSVKSGSPAQGPISPRRRRASVYPSVRLGGPFIRERRQWRG